MLAPFTSDSSPSVEYSASQHIYDLCRSQRWSELKSLIPTLLPHQHVSSSSSPNNINNEPPYQDFAGGGGNTALHEAMDLTAPISVLSLLIQYSPRMIAIQNKYGETPLHLAASCPRLDRMLTLLTLLISNCDGTCVLITDRFGRTPLHLLYSRRKEEEDDEEGTYSEYSRLLDNYEDDPFPDPDDENDEQHSDLLTDSTTAFITDARNTLDHTDDPMLIATQLLLSRLEPYSQITTLLQSVDFVTQRTPLHEACYHHISYSTIDFIISSCPTAVSLQDVHGNTPLHLLTELMDLHFPYESLEDYEQEYHPMDGKHPWKRLLDIFLSLDPNILTMKNHSHRTPLAHAIFHFAPWSVLHHFLQLEHSRLWKGENVTDTYTIHSILWDEDCTRLTPIRLLHSTHTESPHPQQIRDLTAHMVHIMLEFPPKELLITSLNKKEGVPSPWSYDLEKYNPTYYPYLIHNCFRLGKSCPLEYVYQEWIQPDRSHVVTREKLDQGEASTNAYPWMEQDSWGTSPISLFLDSVPTFIQEWDHSIILAMWKDMIYISSNAHVCKVPLLAPLLTVYSNSTNNPTLEYPLWIQMCRIVLQSHPRAILEEGGIPRSLYPYLIRILAMDEYTDSPHEQMRKSDNATILFECIRCLPELFMIV